MTSASVPSRPTAAARVPCPVCGSSPADHKFLFEKQAVQFWRCARCGFEFVNPRPSEEWLAAQYDFYGTHVFLDERRLRTDFDSAHFDVEWQLIGNRRGTLLDVGCSTGAFVKLALQSGFEAEGIDLSEPATNFGRTQLGLPLRCGDFAAHVFPEASFDVVTLWATLEHLPDPGVFLAEAHRVLRPSGTLVLTVPNHDSATQRLLGRRNRYVGADHLNYFTARTLARLVQRHGFHPEAVLTRKFNPFIVYKDLRRSPSDGASADEVLADQSVTDTVKDQARYAPLRAAHSLIERVVGRFGLGDLLLLRASRSLKA